VETFTTRPAFSWPARAAFADTDDADCDTESGPPDCETAAEDCRTEYCAAQDCSSPEECGTPLCD
jgi:hypothetical protein